MTWWDAVWFVLSHVPALLAAWWAFSAKKQVHQVHLQINSRMDELLKSVRAEGRSAGLRERAGEPQEPTP